MCKLYLVPTPIGNLEDITLRAIRILKEVDLILAEDTRNSGKLLKHLEVQTPMQSHHMHNEHKTVDHIVSRIKNGGANPPFIFGGRKLLAKPWFRAKTFGPPPPLYIAAQYRVSYTTRYKKFLVGAPQRRAV